MEKNRSFYSLAITAFLLSCSQKHETPQSKTIGVTLLTRGHMFYRDLEEGLTTEAAKYNYELIITAAEFDMSKQIGQIEDFVARKVDAIILCPVDSKGIGAGVKKANDANIPVFTADISSQEGEVVSHIASDNVAGGRLAGEYMAKLLNGKGKIAIINQPVVSSVLDRVQGFGEAIAKFPGIVVVADVNGQGVRDKALQATTDILQANPSLDGIFGINDDSALGALDAVQQFKRSNIVIIGYDAIPPAAEAIRRGTALRADVVQYPKKIGTTTIQKIQEFFSGAQVPKVVPVEVGIVDQEALLKMNSQ
ncbi:MAG: substrate-binding domain-containing protein [Ignavibacteriales bacterium]|nr:substrate-binding domain-containing protein [Ignavibacteriales bacterium]